MNSSPSTASLSLTGSRLKAQLDASRRPPHAHHIRRVVSSHTTPRKKREQQRERPKTVAETRSSPPIWRNGDLIHASSLSASSSPAKESSPCHAYVARNTSPDDCAAPTPPHSRSNSTKAPTSSRTSSAKGSGEGCLTIQPSSGSSPKRQTPSKLKLRDSLSPVKVPSTPAFARSSPDIDASGSGDPMKRDDPRLGACASPPKRTPSKLKLKRSTPTVDLASLGRSPSPRSPARSTPNATAAQPCPSPSTAAKTKPGHATSAATRQTRKD